MELDQNLPFLIASLCCRNQGQPGLEDLVFPLCQYYTSFCSPCLTIIGVSSGDEIGHHLRVTSGPLHASEGDVDCGSLLTTGQSRRKLGHVRAVLTGV